MDDLNLRPDAGGGVGVGVRNQEFQDIDVARIAAALVGRAGIDEERHDIKTVTYDPKSQRRHTPVLVSFNTGLIGQRQAHDFYWRHADPRTDLHDASGDEAPLVALSFVFILVLHTFEEGI